MKTTWLILGVLGGLAISTPAQTAREQIGLGAPSSFASSPSSAGFAQPPSNQTPPKKFCKVNGQVYQVNQLENIYGVVRFKEKGVVILSKFKVNNYGEVVEDENGRMFALTNYQGEVIADGPFGSYFGKKVGTYDWGSSPLELFDCGTPYIPPPPTPEQIATAKAAQEKAKADAKAKAAAQNQAAAERRLWLDATNGVAAAQYQIGLRFLNGQGVETNRLTALYWLHKAANQGDAEATATLTRLQK